MILWIENTLKARYPEAKSDTWGVPDEYMFRYAAEVLAEAEQSGKPVFVMMMSMTNHPPYKLPAPHQRLAFKLDNQEQSRLSQLATGEALNEILNTFRYSNDQLGRFISEVKQHAPHTVIAATGDHEYCAPSAIPSPTKRRWGTLCRFICMCRPNTATKRFTGPNGRAGIKM